MRTSESLLLGKHAMPSIIDSESSIMTPKY
jgi:hypothetical protein